MGPADPENRVENRNGHGPLTNKSNEITKTESIFKFPKGSLWDPAGLRDTILLSPQKWLQKKRDFDGIGKLWRVHDKLYDLTSYIDQHPGGSDWLSLTQGTDITELFMSSHVVNVKLVDSVLENFYIGPAEGERNAPYTFKENDFYMTLKRRIEPILKKHGTGPTLHSKLVIDGAALAFLATGVLGAIYSSNFLLILSGLFLYCVTACAHNFFHVKETWRRCYWDLSFMPSYDFKIVHCLSHHVFTNTRLDFEGMAFEPFINHRHLKSKSLLQRYGPAIYLHLVFALALQLNFVFKMIRIFVIKEHRLRPENFLVFGEFFLLTALAPTFSEGTYSFLIIHATCSYLLMIIGLTVAHHDTSCYHDGDQLLKANPDWGRFQMEVTRDTAQDFSDNLLLTSVSFGEHPMHHLFPTVCHSKYHLIKPVMMETMAEFGMENPRLDRLELFVATFKNFAKNTPNFLYGTSKTSQ